MPDEKWSRVFQLAETLSNRPSESLTAELDLSGEDSEVVEALKATFAAVEAAGAESVHKGMRLGRYEVGDPLGSGAYGEVFRGRDTLLGRSVAMKFLSSTTLLPKSAARALLEEAQAASALNHPNIVTIHDVLDTDSGPVIVMELIEGLALRTVLRTAPIPADLAVQYSVQLLEALAAAHANGIVHRDVKPENIMVRSDGYIKVLDFGLARQVNDPETGVPILRALPAGTLRYMPPERFNGQTATAASDMFAAGLVVCEIATGQHAFGDATPVETVARMLKEAPQPKGKGPLIDLSMRLLARDPKERLTAPQGLAFLGDSARRTRLTHWLG